MFETLSRAEYARAQALANAAHPPRGQYENYALMALDEALAPIDDRPPIIMRAAQANHVGVCHARSIVTGWTRGGLPTSLALGFLGLMAHP